MPTFFSVQSALLPVEPVYKLLVKAGSYLSASQYSLKHTSLLLPTLLYHLYLWTCTHLLISSHHLSPSMHSNPALLRCICEDKVTCPPSLSQTTAHPLTVQNITRFGCKSTWILPSGRLLFSHSPAPFLLIKSVITSVCKEDDSGRCGGPSDQTPHGLP